MSEVDGELSSINYRVGCNHTTAVTIIRFFFPRKNVETFPPMISPSTPPAPGSCHSGATFVTPLVYRQRWSSCKPITAVGVNVHNK